jgi:hypothetical protein
MTNAIGSPQPGLSGTSSLSMEDLNTHGEEPWVYYFPVGQSLEVIMAALPRDRKDQIVLAYEDENENLRFALIEANRIRLNRDPDITKIDTQRPFEMLPGATFDLDGRQALIVATDKEPEWRENLARMQTPLSLFAPPDHRPNNANPELQRLVRHLAQDGFEDGFVAVRHRPEAGAHRLGLFDESGAKVFSTNAYQTGSHQFPTSFYGEPVEIPELWSAPPTVALIEGNLDWEAFRSTVSSLVDSYNTDLKGIMGIEGEALLVDNQLLAVQAGTKLMAELAELFGSHAKSAGDAMHAYNIIDEFIGYIWHPREVTPTNFFARQFGDSLWATFRASNSALLLESLGIGPIASQWFQGATSNTPSNIWF